MVFDSLIARFQAADRNLRLETLLDFSRKLPDPPAELQLDAARAAYLVNECQTPVYLWTEVRDGKVVIHADVPRESPTVRGYVALLHSKLNGLAPIEVAQVPDDLLDRLGLTETLGMMRTQGLTAILGRIKRAVAAST
jgi:cysteine desulfuration protein SufE